MLRVGAVDATVEQLDRPVHGAEQAARELGCRLDRIVETDVFVCDGEYVLALTPGDRDADERKVAAAVAARSVRPAQAEDVVAATGFEPGCVAPFPRRDAVAALIERTLLQHETVWISAGSAVHLALLTTTDLQRLAGARAVDLIA